MGHDVVVVGGSYAGLSAALQLGRARQRVLVVDGGQRRNRFATHSHGFLTQDGTPAAEIAALGKAQVLAYPTVAWLDGQVVAVEGEAGAFQVRLASGESVQARRLILALGMRDDLPALPGLAEAWGKQVFHCPYCHGYELNQGPVGVLAFSAMAMHQALLLPDWGPTTLFLNGAFEPNAEEHAQLARRGVAVQQGRLVGLEAGPSESLPVLVRLEDGQGLPFAGLFTASTLRPSSPLAEALGCAMESTPMGEVVQCDLMKATSVRGVFACGDLAKAPGTVAQAVADGAMAGAGAHRSLLCEAAGLPW